MKSLWNDADAARMVADYDARGVSRDLALRIYTTRLLGGDPCLEVHRRFGIRRTRNRRDQGAQRLEPRAGGIERAA